MNDIFDFKRFAKLLKYECVNYLPRYIKGMVVFVSFLVAAWLFSIVSEIEFSTRAPFMNVLFYFAIFLSPYFVYKEMNNRKKGYSYAMLPASTFEKLLSMSVVSILIVPVLVYLALSVTDVILYAISCAGAGNFTGLEFCNPLSLALPEWYLGEGFIDFFDAKLLVLSYVLSITVFMMFNSIFRKNKIIKTLLFNMGVQFLLQILFVFLAISNPGDILDVLRDWFVETFGNCTEAEIVSMLYNTAITLNVVSIAVVTTITYFRIKRVNY